MAVRVITGRPDRSDRLHQYLYAEIGETIKKISNHHHFLIVPDQYTYGAEQALMQALHVPGLMSVDVVSLGHLGRRILTEVGGSTLNVVDDHGRLMLMAKAINLVSDQLKLYKKSAIQPGFISSASELISELKQNRISGEDFQSVKGAFPEESWFWEKLNEMALIYDQYEQCLGPDQTDIDGYSVLLCDAIAQSAMIRNATIWIDGFFTFSANDFAIIEALALQAKDLVMTLSCDLDETAGDGDIFMICRQTAQRMSEIAQKTKQPFEITTLPVHESDRSPFSLIRDQLYHFNPHSWEENASEIRFFRYLNPWEEAKGVAKLMIELIRTKGIHFEDIRILCGDTQMQGPVLSRALSDYGISSFCDQVTPLSDDPLIEMLLNALEAVATDYKTEALYAYAKSGYGSLSFDRFSQLENYALAKGIKGRQWSNPFLSNLEQEQWPMDELELDRQILISPLKRLKETLDRSEVIRDGLIGLVDFLETTHVIEMISHTAEKLNAAGDFEAADRLQQIWTILMSVFDQMDEVMGEDPFELKAFIQILKSSLCSYSIGVLPTKRDVVRITDAFRSRGTSVKVLFVVGANEGLLPKEREYYNLLSEEDRRALAKVGVVFQDDPVFRRRLMDYSLYSQLTKATETVILSYTMTDSKGESLLPSDLMRSFRKLFPQNELITVSESNMDASVFTVGYGSLDEAVQCYSRCSSSPGIQKQAKKILSWFEDQSVYREQTKMGLAAKNYSGLQNASIKQAMVDQLYGDHFQVSTSRVEQYHACPFAHFMRYGLKPSPREEYVISPADMGSLIHQIIEAFYKQSQINQIDLNILDEVQQFQLADQVMDEILERTENGIFQSSGTNRYLGKRLKRLGRQTLKMLVAQQKQGRFDFLSAEQRFSLPIKGENIPEGIRLAGIVDRIDLFTREGQTYIKVIDYKTGDKRPDYTEIYYGVSIQLLVYLMAGLDFLKDSSDPESVLLPAGTFYFHASDPLVQMPDAKLVETEINKAFKMSGFYLDDAEVQKALGAESKTLPVYKKGNGLSEESFASILDFVSSKINDAIDGILSGQVGPKQLKTAQYDSCAWCEYKEICQWDLMPVFKQEKIKPTISKDAFFAMIQEKRDDHGTKMD